LLEHGVLDRAAADRAHARPVRPQEQARADLLRRGARGAHHRGERAAPAPVEHGQDGLGDVAHRARIARSTTITPLPGRAARTLPSSAAPPRSSAPPARAKYAPGT